MLDHTSFKDKVAIITGAGSGIGEACTKLFYDKGAVIVLVGRSNKVTKLANSFNDDKRVLAIETDLTIEENVKNLIDIVLKNYYQLELRLIALLWEMKCPPILFLK